MPNEIVESARVGLMYRELFRTYPYRMEKLITKYGSRECIPPELR